MKITPTLGGAYSGSLGGMTASHNAGGPYLRRRAIPTNPNTARQQLIRSAMGSAVQAWSMALTEPQRQAWRDYASSTPVTDALGQSITLSGINMFARTNVPQLQQDLVQGNSGAMIFSAPTTFNTGEPVASFQSFTGDFTTPPGTIEGIGTIPAGASDDGLILVFVAPPQTPGVRFFKGPYQLAAILDIAEDATSFGFSTLDLATDWWSSTIPVAAWGGLSVPLRMRILYDDGRLSEVFEMFVPFTDATP